MDTYFNNSYLGENQTTITCILDRDDSIAVYCKDTIFYPQGGGQPCDIGIITINGTDNTVYHVETTELGVAHIMKANPDSNSWIGMKCDQRIDLNRRVLNAKSHSAGHLISHVFEDMNSNLYPVKGHHFPDSSYIELSEKERTNETFCLELANIRINELIDESRPIQSIELNLSEAQSLRPLLSKFIPQNTTIRMITVYGFTPLPCGGTHVTNTGDLKGLKVTRIKRKKDRIKVNYSIN